MLHSKNLFKKIFIVLMGMLLLFNTNYGAFKTQEAHASTFTSYAAASYASVVVGVMTVATGAMHTEQFIKDHGQQIYDTAKATWPKMSSDMQANFLSSMSQAADGIVTVGDWITVALDALKADFGGTSSSVDFEKYLFTSSTNGKASVSFTPESNLTFRFNGNNHPALGLSASYEFPGGVTLVVNNGDNVVIKDVEKTREAVVGRIASATDLSSFLSVAGRFGFGLAVVDVATGQPPMVQENIYNHLDNWIRQRAQAQDHPEGRLGVYAPTEAWTTSGIRLGLDPTGTQLLTLPDGVPYDPALHGDYSWRKPLTQVIDGVGAILDSAIGSWVNLQTGKKIRDATIPEMASATGVDESTAEYVFIKAKEEEKAREEKNDDEVENLSRAQKRNLETLDNIVEGHLKESDFTGTLRDLQGNPVPKHGGGYWNHLKEMKDSYKGLNKIKKGLEGSLKNPNLNETERKILQEALDKVNGYTKRIEDLFSNYGGIKKMSKGMTIGEIYNLPAPHKNDEYSLEQWYVELYNKQIEGISTLDVIRMLEQNILEDLAIKKAVELLQEDPLAGNKFDGQLMETLLSTDMNKLSDSVEDIKKMVSDVSLKLNELDWLNVEDKEEFADLLKEFLNK